MSHTSTQSFMQSSFLNSHLQVKLHQQNRQVWLSDLPLRDFVPYALPQFPLERFNQMASLLAHLWSRSRVASWQLYLGVTDPHWRAAIEPDVLRDEQRALRQYCPGDAQERRFADQMLLLGAMKTIAVTDRAVLAELAPANDGLFIAWHPQNQPATVMARVHGELLFLPQDQVLGDTDAPSQLIEIR